MSDKRFSHTLAVVRCAEALGELILPGRINELCVAAMLHDVAKEIPKGELLTMLEESGFDLTRDDRLCEGVLHSFAAPLVIEKDFAELASHDVLSATRNHTLGAPGMSVFDMIIFISDYAEDTRTYPSCKAVRSALFDNLERLNKDERVARLRDACLMAVDYTIDALSRRGDRINPRIFDTRRSLLLNNKEN
jgi:predicted HD superfamily hydrolase involved in NAD metabolism